MPRYITNSPRATKRLGFELARRFKRNRRGAVAVALEGPLGAGKTTFVRGILRALGVRGRATSPTFVLLKRAAIPVSRRGAFSAAYHADFYRLRGASAAGALGFREILQNPGNVVLIEWAGNVPRFLPKRALRVSFAHGAHAKERRIIIRHGQA